MSSIEFDIDQSRGEFLLKGDVNELLKNRRVKYFLLRSFGAELRGETVIAIKFTRENRELWLKEIQDAFVKYGVDQDHSPEIKKALSHYYSEKEKFADFSEKARKIWENEVDLGEFEKFKISLEEYLPSRVLYDKQLLASFHLAFAQNSCNFSVPGAGKTSVVYGAFAYLKNLPEEHPKHIDKLLIIGPLSSFGPWEDEYLACFGEPVASKRLSGGVSKGDRDRYLLSLEAKDSLPDLTLMSYQSVSFNLDNLTAFLSRKSVKYMIVLDEAHKIKNVDGGVWASSVLSLAKQPSVNSRVVLTGTPVPNGYEDIYNLYEFIWPDKDIIKFNAAQLREISNNDSDTRIDGFIKSIEPFYIRIRKGDILEPTIYPVKNHEPLCVEMGAVQREIYDYIENRYLDYFERNQSSYSIAAKLIKARFVRLMQAATNPCLLKDSLESYYAEQGLSNDLGIDDSLVLEKVLKYKELEGVPRKFEAVRNLVSKILKDREKVVVWGTFVKSAKELQIYLSDSGIASELLIGEVPVDRDDIAEDVLTREKIIRMFHQSDSSFKVIIANPFAVAESISLHKACHHAIYFERTFNASNFIQSKDRIHRVGLAPGTVTNYHYVLSRDSVDETIHRRLLEKEAKMLELIESREIPLISENLNYDIDLESDLKAIIRDYVKRTIEV